MKHYTILAFLCLSMVLSVVTAETPKLPLQRTITDGNGRMVEVTVLSVTKEFLRARRTSDGKEFEVPLPKLTAEDRKFADEFVASASSGTAKEDPLTSAKPKNPAEPLIQDWKKTEVADFFKDVPPLDTVLNDIQKEMDEIIEDRENEAEDDKQGEFSEVAKNKYRVYAEELRGKITKARDGSADSVMELYDFVFKNEKGEGNIRHLHPYLIDLLRIILLSNPNHQAALDKLLVDMGNYSIEINDEDFECFQYFFEKGNSAAISIAMKLRSSGNSSYASDKIIEAIEKSKLPYNQRSETLQAVINQLYQEIFIDIGSLTSYFKDHEKLIKMAETEAARGNRQVLKMIVQYCADMPEMEPKCTKPLDLAKQLANSGDKYMADVLVDYYNYKKLHKETIKWCKKAGDRAKVLEKSILKNEYDLGEVVVKEGYMELTSRIYGKKNSDKSVVVFRPDRIRRVMLNGIGWRADQNNKTTDFDSKDPLGKEGLGENLIEFKKLLDAGWCVIEIHNPFDFPSVDQSTGNKIQEELKFFNSKTKIKYDDEKYAGFVTRVLAALKSQHRINRFHIIANSYSAAVMARDMEKIQADKNIAVTWISPNEIGMVSIERLKNLNKFNVISMPGDPYAVTPEFKQWIQSNHVPASDLGNVPDKHLVLNKDFTYKMLADYLTKKLK